MLPQRTASILQCPKSSVIPLKPDPILQNLTMNTPIIHLKDIRKSYFMGKQALPVLKGISLDIFKNEYVALMGPSGSGKSTLMNIIGCLDSPTEGRYILNGQDVSEMPDDDLAEVRNKE